LLPSTWRELALVILTATTVGMTIALTMPLLTLNLERAGADPFTIGVNATAGGLGIFLVGPFIDRLAARLGTVGCYRLGLLVCAACLLLFSVRVDPWYWFAVRLVYGCAGAVMFVLNEAAVNGLTPDAQRGRVIGLYATLFTVGYAGGPLLLVLAGTEGITPFLAAAGLFLAALLPTIPLRAVEARLRPVGGRRTYALPDIWRAAPLALAAVLVYAVIEGAAFALMPVWGLSLGLGERAAAALVGVWLSGNILSQVPIGWLADRTPRSLVLAGCCLLASLGLLALPLLPGHAAPLWVILVALGGLTGGCYTLALMLLGDRFRGPDLTVANTAFVMTFQLGMIAGPPVVGAAMRAVGPAAFPLTLALALLALAPVAAAASRPATIAPPRAP
jgi:MFS family permease